MILLFSFMKPSAFSKVESKLKKMFKKCYIPPPSLPSVSFKREVKLIESLLASGCEPLDNLLRGGFEKGIVTQVYGAAGSGKTNLCLQLAVECVRQGQRVIYIDSEGLSPLRFKQIAGKKAKEIAGSVLIYEPLSFEEQYASVREVEKIAGENIGLVVLDSATSFYRFELEDEDSGIRGRRELANQIGFLHALARKYGFVALITNQIYSDIELGGVRPLGGTSLEHISKTILQFERTGKGTRRAILIKHRSSPEGSSCTFRITGEGLR